MGNKEYLDRVVNHMVKLSKDNGYPFNSTKMSFSDFCEDTFGLTGDEVSYVFYKYRYLMGWDQYDRSLPYIKNI